MATTQMNTRIDSDLKAAGDAAFGSVGYTPTQVVRAVWGFAARNATRLEEVEKMLRGAEGLDSSEEQERSRKAALAEAGPAIFERLLRDAGVSKMPEPRKPARSPAEARERAAVERALQKGWIDE